MKGKVQVSAAQFAPVFLDRKSTIRKAGDIMAEAARAGSKLIVFPEAFIPGYPCWVWKLAAGEDRQLQALYVEYLMNSVGLGGSEVDDLCRAARQNKINVVMGVSERNDEASRTSMFNSVLFIDEKGLLLGRLCALICWENDMPLARYAMFAQGPQIYCALTWDRAEPWLSSMRHIAREGRLVPGEIFSELSASQMMQSGRFRRKCFFPLRGLLPVPLTPTRTW